MNPAPSLSHQELSRLQYNAARTIQNREKCSWDVAWNRARDRHSAVDFSGKQQPVTNRESRPDVALRQLGAIAAGIRNRLQCTHVEAGRLAHSQRPDLVAALKGEHSAGRIENRATPSESFAMPADDCYHIIPKGEFPYIQASGPTLIQVLDDVALDSILNSFTEDSRLPNFPGILIDQDHFSYDRSMSSEAFGWIKSLEKRPDGLWGRIAWTDSGDAAVANGRYLFLSPVFDSGDLQKLGGGRVRPLRLETAAVTNTPNLKTLTPLTSAIANRQGTK